MAWESYEKTEEIVLAYKNREPMAAEKLLNAFSDFTNKYYEVIVDGKVNLTNQSIRRFIAMFMKNEEYRGNIHKFKRAPTVLVQAYISTSQIKSMFKIYEPDEIRNILAINLLELADRYEPLDDSPRFHTYLLKSYHYKVYHSLVSTTKDPVYRCALEGTYLNENDAEIATYDTYNLNTIDKKYNFLMTESDCIVDDNWVAGFTADIFSELSSVDRKILKLKYADGLTDTEISGKLSVCRATINRRRIRIEKELKAKLMKLKMIKE